MLLNTSALCVQFNALRLLPHSLTCSLQIAVFVDDLAEFLSFQSHLRSNAVASSKDRSSEGVEGDRHTNSAAAFGLMDVLAAEARRPEMDLMMGEVRVCVCTC